MSLVVRRARASDVENIVALLGPYIERGELLPRDPSEISGTIDHWVVAIEGNKLLGCGSLVAYSDELSEVRSLAVVPGYRGMGIGRALMEMLVEVARGVGVRRLFGLTRVVPFFIQSGFASIDIVEIPEKVWRDCAPCPLRDRCDEHPVMLVLSNQRPGRQAVPADGRGGNRNVPK
ncbi:MAG TPA: GNAT family N-acetyltransferase [Anaerolineales bacterium]|nr:GNAT family N-acetyltransferase [Anaerolineales bacterium]